MTIGFWRAALHLGGLWALAFAQPLFALLGDEPQFFVARGSRPVDIVVLALGYGLVPPLAGAGLVWCAGRLRPRLGLAVHAVLVALLVAALALPPAGDLLGGSTASVPLAVAAGAGIAAAYLRAPGLRALLTALSPAPLVVVALFLLLSPVSPLVTGGEARGSTAGPEASSTPIVHVVFDELPVTTLTGAGGRLDARRFPNLARLARRATWYRNATTVADSTLEALPAQLTGEWPREGLVPTVRDHPRSLFTLFSRSHDLLVVEPITDLCPRELCPEDRGPAAARLRALAADVSVVAQHLLLPADLRDGLAPVDRTWAGFGSADMDAAEPPPTGRSADIQRSRLGEAVGVDLRRSDTRAGFALLTEALRRPHARPPLVFMHATLPHAPWRHLPDGRRYPLPAGDPSGLEGKSWSGRQWAADQAFQRHVLQTSYADALLGGLLDELRASERFDDAVIVVTADHGASFRAGQRRRSVRAGNLADVAGVPFFVKWPGQRHGRVSDGAVRTVDVLPTIAKATGTRVPWRTAGAPADERRAELQTPIRVTHAGSPGVVAPVATLLDRRGGREAAEARILRRGTYAAGPRPNLVGRRVSTAVAGRPHATVDAPERYAHLVDGADVLPAFVSGDLRGVEPDAVIAVAVNGRVEATTRAYPDGNGLDYRALVPPSSLTVGAAVITVLEVLPGDRLRPIGGTNLAAP